MNAFEKDKAYFITVSRKNGSLVSDKHGELNYILIKNIRREGTVYIGTDEDNKERRFNSMFIIEYTEYSS